MSGNTNDDKTSQAREIDLSTAGRGVWLVKVPKYLSEKWKGATGNCDVGKMRITRSKLPGLKPEVTFTMSDEQQKVEIPGKPTATPKEHQLLLTGVGSQNLVVFSEEKEKSASATAQEITDRIAIEGKVIQRAECRPVVDTNYMRLKKASMDASNKPRREIKQISGVVNIYKPVSEHANQAKKPKDVVKRIRQDKEVVTNKLFEIFEKHQYYNIQDLVRLTDQPITYLKEILKEICTYNVKAPHKNMWELKPEYRHYKEQK